MRLSNGVPVPPGGTARRFELVAQACRDRADRGISILVFPEAHRTLDGSIGNFRRGVFEIARQAGLPLVPICVRGLYEVLPKGTIITRPGRIEVFVGAQIETDGLGAKDLPTVMDRVRATMKEWVERGIEPSSVEAGLPDALASGSERGDGANIVATGCVVPDR